MKRIIVLVFLASMLVSFIQLPAAAEDNFDLVRQRWYSYLIGGDGEGEEYIQDRINSINTSAYYQWQRINRSADRTYLFQELSAKDKSAQVTQCYNLLGIMAQAYSIPGGFLYGNTQLESDLISALDWMYENRYNNSVQEYDNWWDWEIGAPTVLNDIMVMLYDQLGAQRIQKYTDAIRYFAPNPKICAQQMYPFESTAANRVSMCKVAALCGILTKNAEITSEASNALAPVFQYVNEGDGFYTDGSFIQHTKLPYTGGYGLGLMDGLTEMIYMLDGSGWDIDSSDIIFDWFYNSFVPFTYDGLMMDSVTGRNASRDYNQAYCAATLFDIAVMLTDIAPEEKSAELKKLAAAWLAQDKLNVIFTESSMFTLTQISGLSGAETVSRENMHKQFPAMDRTVHHRESYAFAISKSSQRIYNYESILNENLRGWHTSDGMTYLYDDDYTQYTDNFWPTVDASRLSGTTVEQRPLQNAEYAGKEGGGTQVGGASVGDYGVDCMELAPAGSELLARKAWFMFDDEIIALGADITDTSDYTVETVIDNRMTDSACLFTQGDNWAHISGKNGTAGVGYYIPDKSRVKSIRENRSGAWSDINAATPQTVYTREYVTMWFEHGIKPEQDTYAYALLPGKTSEQTADYAENPAFEILENSEYAQAVRQKELGIIGAVFWKDEKHAVSDITSSGRACVIAQENDGVVSVGISDPTQSQEEKIIIELNTSAADIVSCGDRIEVLSCYPTIKLAFDAKDSRGVSSEVILAKVKSPWKTAARLDNAISIELQKTGDVLIGENGIFTYRKWANGTTVYGCDEAAAGFGTVCINQISASEYKDNFLIPDNMIMRDGVTRLEFDVEVSSQAEGLTAQLMLKLNGAVGFLPLTGNLLGAGVQKVAIVIDMEEGLVYTDINGVRVKTAIMNALPDENDLSDIRLYTVAKPVSGGFEDGTDKLASAVNWKIYSINVSNAKAKELLYIGECGVGDGRYGVVVKNDTSTPKAAAVYAAAYIEAALVGVVQAKNELIECGGALELEGEFGNADECVIYLWDADMHPYDIHRLKLPNQ